MLVFHNFCFCVLHHDDGSEEYSVLDGIGGVMLDLAPADMKDRAKVWNNAINFMVPILDSREEQGRH